MITFIKKTDSKRKKNNVYLSTHEVLTRQITSFSDEQIALMIKKNHPIRQIQDKYCYVHSVVNGVKIFNPKQHKNLESVIRNNIKLFHIFYIKEISEQLFFKFMAREAFFQHSLFKSMKYINVVLNRHVMISYFLSYSFSRSADYYNNPDVNNG